MIATRGWQAVTPIAWLALALWSLAACVGCSGKISAESVREKYRQGARDPAGDERDASPRASDGTAVGNTRKSR